MSLKPDQVAPHHVREELTYWAATLLAFLVLAGMLAAVVAVALSPSQ